MSKNKISFFEELQNINKVQILVDGDSGFMYREKMSLNALYEFNKENLLAYCAKTVRAPGVSPETHIRTPPMPTVRA